MRYRGGFSPLGVVLAIAIVGVAAVILVPRYWSAFRGGGSAPLVSAPADWKLFEDTEYGFSFKYPPAFTVYQEDKGVGAAGVTDASLYYPDSRVYTVTPDYASASSISVAVRPGSPRRFAGYADSLQENGCTTKRAVRGSRSSVAAIYFECAATEDGRDSKGHLLSLNDTFLLWTSIETDMLSDRPRISEADAAAFLDSIEISNEGALSTDELAKPSLRTYTNEAFGFSLKYPSNYYLDNDNTVNTTATPLEDSNMNVTFAERAFSEEQSSFVSFDMFPNPQRLTALEWLERKYIAAYGDRPTASDTTPVTVGGASGVKFPSKQARGTVFLFPHGVTMYKVSANKEAVSTASTILSSIVFTAR